MDTLESDNLVTIMHIGDGEIFNQSPVFAVYLSM